METTTSTPSNSTGLRSTFLTVICVLTFIGSGWGIIKAVRNYAQANTIANIAGEAMEKAKDTMDDQNAPNFAKQLLSSVSENLSPDNIRKTSIFELISCLLTLTGAIMMWNLNKAGFYLYILGIVVLVIAPILVMGKGLLGGLAASVSAFIGVVFIAMYAVNLKDMKK